MSLLFTRHAPPRPLPVPLTSHAGLSACGGGGHPSSRVGARAYLCCLSPCAHADASSPRQPLASPRVTCHLSATSSAGAASAARPRPRASARAPALVRCGAPWSLSSFRAHAHLSALVAPMGSFVGRPLLLLAVYCLVVCPPPSSRTPPCSVSPSFMVRARLLHRHFPGTHNPIDIGSSRSLSKPLEPCQWRDPPLIGAAAMPYRPSPRLLLCACPPSAGSNWP